MARRDYINSQILQKYNIDIEVNTQLRSLF